MAIHMDKLVVEPVGKKKPGCVRIDSRNLLSAVDPLPALFPDASVKKPFSSMA